MENLTKCYCGHTTTCDCGPEEPKQEDLITKIMQMDAKMAYDSLPKQSTKDRILSETSEVTKQKVRDTANKLVVRPETPGEVAERLYPIIETNDYMDWYDKNYDIRNSFIEGAKWQQEHIIDFLHSEIIERRDYSASKMCEKVIEFIEQFKNK